jgi:hypothetical protein
MGDERNELEIRVLVIYSQFLTSPFELINGLFENPSHEVPKNPIEHASFECDNKTNRPDYNWMIPTVIRRSNEFEMRMGRDPL